MDLADSAITPTALRDQLLNYPIVGLRQLIIINKRVFLSLLILKEGNVAINLFCYSSLPYQSVRNIVDSITAQNVCLFANKFLISEIDDLSDSVNYYDKVAVEVAMGHGFMASNLFLISLNDKKSANLISNVERVLKKVFSCENILILFNNEEKR